MSVLTPVPWIVSHAVEKLSGRLGKLSPPKALGEKEVKWESEQGADFVVREDFQSSAVTWK